MLPPLCRRLAGRLALAAVTLSLSLPAQAALARKDDGGQKREACVDSKIEPGAPARSAAPQGSRAGCEPATPSPDASASAASRPSGRFPAFDLIPFRRETCAKDCHSGSPILL